MLFPNMFLILKKFDAMRSSFYKTFQIDPFKEMEYFLEKYNVHKFKQKTLKCIKN